MFSLMRWELHVSLSFFGSPTKCLFFPKYAFYMKLGRLPFKRVQAGLLELRAQALFLSE